MSGRIEAENRDTGGCRFRVTLPLSDLPAEPDAIVVPAPAPAPDARSGEAPPMTILVADDEPLATQEIKAFLERGGHP